MVRTFVLSLSFLVGSCNQVPDQEQRAEAKVEPSMGLTGRIVDEADLISDETEEMLNAKLVALEKSVGPQFVIATTQSLDGQKIEDYALKLGRIWAIGDSSRDDGVILLVAPNEKKVRIEVGYGLEASLSDPFCAKVIRETILPHFNKNDMEIGIVKGADRLIEKMKRSPTIEVNDNEKEEKVAA